jgi:hypothetical protein
MIESQELEQIRQRLEAVAEAGHWIDKQFSGPYATGKIILLVALFAVAFITCAWLFILFDALANPCVLTPVKPKAQSSIRTRSMTRRAQLGSL